MEFNSISGVGAPAAINNTPQLSESKGEELRENFLTMLITQIKNQDPLKPMENAELTSQLAQINTVTGIEQLNETLKGINNQMEAGYALQAAALIGKGVMVSGDNILVGDQGATTPFAVELGRPAAEVTATIVDGTGLPVRSFALGALGEGYESLVWDGTLETGEYATPGAYSVVIQALDYEGVPVDVGLFNYAMVQAVSTTNGAAMLDLGGVSEPVSLDEVKQIL